MNLLPRTKAEHLLVRTTSTEAIARVKKTWPDADREVRSAFLRALLQGHVRGATVSQGGVNISGAIFHQGLDLSHLTCEYPIRLRSCKFKKQVNLRYLKAHELDLEKSNFCEHFDAGGIGLWRHLFAIGCTFARGVNLYGADIGGNCNFRSTAFVRPHKDRWGNVTCFNADCAHIRGYLCLDGNDNDSSSHGCTIRGPVSLLNTRVDSHLKFCKTRIGTREEVAIGAVGLEVGGSLYLDKGFRARGEILLTGAKVNGDLLMSESFFQPSNGSRSIVLDRIEVGGKLFMKDSSVAGTVSLANASVGAEWNCELSQKGVLAPNIVGPGLCVAGATTMNWMYVPKTVSGPVPSKHGPIWDFTGARFQSKLECDCNGVLGQGEKFGNQGSVILSDSEIGTLDIVPLLGAKELFLQGAQYRAISNPNKSNVDCLLVLIKKGSGSSFFPQPYRQLFKALKDSGESGLATDVIIKMHEERHQHLLTNTKGMIKLSFWVASRVSSWSKYGYRCHRLLVPAVLIWLTGSLVYTQLVFSGEFDKRMAPIKGAELRSQVTPYAASSNEEYPGFSAPIYALDVFLPVVDFGQATVYHPRVKHEGSADQRIGWCLTALNWVLTASGWALTTLLLAAMSGVTRRVDADS